MTQAPAGPGRTRAEGPSPLPVTFLLAGEADLAGLGALDPEADWREFVRGERAWILQSYLRLRRAGLPVALSPTLPETGLVVFHAKQRRALTAAGGRLRDRLLVGVRADNREPLIADFEILQNGRFADGRSRFALPHWPQAGLIPRDPGRGQKIARIAYKGFLGNLHRDFRQPEWRRFLARRGIEWSVDAVDFAGRGTDEGALAWNDYSGVDLVLAVRPPGRGLATDKPATKLFNAWRAGVPALLGPEWACRELRRSSLDYLEVTSAATALEAVERLAADPGLYRAMIDHGRTRAAEVSFAAIAARWEELLFSTLPARAGDPAVRRLRRLPPALKVATKRLLRLATGRPAR
jgi:hypothetical protein